MGSDCAEACAASILVTHEFSIPVTGAELSCHVQRKRVNPVKYGDTGVRMLGAVAEL